MDIAYLFLLAPAVILIAIVVIKAFLSIRDPLRDLNIERVEDGP